MNTQNVTATFGTLATQLGRQLGPHRGRIISLPQRPCTVNCKVGHTGRLRTVERAMNLTVDFSSLKPACLWMSAQWPRPENRRRDEREALIDGPVHLIGIRSEAFAEDLEDGRLPVGLPLPAR